MVSNFFIPNPADTDFPFSEDWEISQWIDEGGAVITQSRYILDTGHPSCLSVVSDTDGKGVYSTIANIIASTKYLFELSYKCVSGQEIDYLVYDNTGAATIVSGTFTATIWSYHYGEFTTPAGCIEIIVYLRAGTGSNEAFYIDDLRLQGNILSVDPDNYSLSYSKSGSTKKTLNGLSHSDQFLVDVEFELGFPLLHAADFDRLFDFHKSKRKTYFNDQDVPTMTERRLLYTEAAYDFVGITKPSVTHIAYEDKGADEPVAKGDFEITEIETADYQVLDNDDDFSYQDTASTTGHYVYHKFVFDISGEYTLATEVKSFEITYKGAANDASSANNDGVTVYAWNINAGNWVKLGSTRVSVKETVSLSLMKQEQAQMFVDTVNGEINILVQTNGTKGAGTALTLDSYYIEVTINKSKSTTIDLLNRAVLNAGDVIYVKNLTEFTTLALGVTYTIGDDGKSIIISGQNAGDMIEVKYNQYYRVASASFAETRLHTNTPTTPARSAVMTLRGMIGME